MEGSGKNSGLTELIACAERALGVPAEQGVESFLELAASYLESFEQWQNGLDESNPLQSELLSSPEKEAFREELLRLSVLHQQLIERAGGEKSELSSQMGEMHRKAAGLKRYVDNFPSRISIAGKRRG